MTTVLELCTFARSKNAGPYVLTCDLFFKDHASYELACAMPGAWVALVSSVFSVEPEQVGLFWVPEIEALKVTLPRPPSGEIGERDVAGAQQVCRLLSHVFPTLGRPSRRSC